VDITANEIERSQYSGQLRKLAIISTFDELCGIAGYTRALVPQLEPFFQVDVLDLDQYLLRNKSKRVQKLAEQHIADMAARLRDYDAVNIQLEHGTLGRTPTQILRRFKMLCAAAPELSVTFHTAMDAMPLDWGQFFATLGRGRVIRAFEYAFASRREAMLSAPLYGFLRRLMARKPVNLIVHTKREMRLLQNVYRLANVHHHPLAFLPVEQAEIIRAQSSRNAFPTLASLPPSAKLLGTFGFLSPYKGFETAIKALGYLPDDYHLAIFGAVHPQTIKRHDAIDPYVETILKQAHIGGSLLSEVAESSSDRVSVNFTVGDNLESLISHPKDLSARVHFVGALSDQEFASAMAICDAVVVPYLEVGQSASGVISIALEMGCRVIASRTLAFLQFARYHPGALEFFDIGNYLELAQRIKAAAGRQPVIRRLAYNTDTNAEVYRIANNAVDRAPANHEVLSGTA
jgi:glycosyltransferase involved in cell wall biosynthesis